MKKFEYFKQLRAFGIKEKDAISMTEQSAGLYGEGEDEEFGRKVEKLASDAVMNFQLWLHCKEGENYWDKLHTKLVAKGL